MRRVIVIAVLAWAWVADAQGVARPRPADPETLLWTTYRNTALTVSMSLAGRVLPAARGFRIEAVAMNVNTSSSGAGNTVITVTDGTNACTATFACLNTTTGPRRVSTVTSAGAGCQFAAGATVTASVTTAGCATTQPSPMFVEFLGRWN